VLRCSEYLGREDWQLFVVCFKIHPVIQTMSDQIQKSRSHLEIPEQNGDTQQGSYRQPTDILFSPNAS
jgi:hypothetical protein